MNEELLLRVNKDRNILHRIERRKANWTGHILRRNCLLKHVIEGAIEGRSCGRQRRCKQLLDYFKERRGYWKLKEEALHCILWRPRFGKSCGPVISQTTTSINGVSDVNLVQNGIQNILSDI
jgi:hypothetical protein